MVATPSTMLPLGTPCPDFQLPDTEGRRTGPADAAGAPALVVMFICNHCPFVKHIRAELARVAREYQPRGAAFFGINANDGDRYPDDHPSTMAAEVRAAGYAFPYLHDASQATACVFRAACTPDFYVFNRERRLAYRGQFDDSRPGNGKPVTGRDLRAALDAVLAGKPAPEPQQPSIGCNIKWKPGHEPDYFRAG